MDVRQFIFFNDADEILFTRTDAESANWQVDELNLTCLFPYVPEKTILRGMRIAFEDDDGVLQPFEVRKVRNYEPDRYQEITCEHIVISELTDIHTGEQELTDASPSSALSSILLAQPDTIRNEKRWTVGNVTATATSSGDISMGSVWQNVRNIETNWNVYILPRVTWSASGITGRYLDIVPASGVWHGFRLSIDKNADELGVTVDDTEVKTALYGYGGNSYTYKTDNLDKDKTPINLIGYTWPGKPSGASINSTLGYIEDTAATAAYGRNGQPRFGFFQNGDISDQATLAQKTWEALQTTNKPVVTVDCMVRDLYRMGYHDEKIRLHDTVMVELLPMNDVLQLEIIKLAVDLLDPTATRPTIGEYIPNIVYIQRQTAETASGGAGRGISGRRGGETETEAKWSEFQAEFVVNNAIMSYHAVQVDHDNKVLKAAGMDIDAQGVIIYAEDNVNQIGSKFKATADAITQEVTDRSSADTTLQSNITQEANRITQIVTAVGSNGEVTAASIVTAINGQTGQSEVKITADKIALDGQTIINLLVGGAVDVYSLTANEVIAGELIFDDGGGTTETSFYTTTIGNKTNPQQIKFLGDNGFSQASTITYADFPHYHKIVATEGTGANAGKITITLTNEVSTSDTTEHITNFNIAATQFYIDAVAAAEQNGIAIGESHFTQATVTLQGSAYGSITPISGSGVTPTQRTLPIASASGTYYLRYTSSLKLSHYGNATLYPSPTPSSVGENHDWYYVDSRSGTSYYQSAGTATAYSVTDYTYYTVPSSYANTTLYKAGNAVTNLRYPGTPDSSTYYTYNPT
jgi:hypothetical protein